MKWSVVKWCPLPRDGVVGWFKLAALPLRSSAGVWLPVEPSGVETAEAHDPRRLFKEGRWKEDILIKAIKCDRVFRRFLRKRYTGEGRKAKKRRRKEETGKRRKSNEILQWRLCRQGFLLSYCCILLNVLRSNTLYNPNILTTNFVTIETFFCKAS